MTTPNRPPLSPATQAVLDAVALAMEGGWISPEFTPYEARKAAAALRAAADQVVPIASYSVESHWCVGFADRDAQLRRDILAIAAELEGDHG